MKTINDTWQKYIIVLFVFSSSLLFAQNTPAPTFVKVDHSKTEWYLESQKENASYFKVKELYDAYFSQHPYEKSIQKSLLRRWFQINSNNVNDAGTVQNSTVSAAESEKFIKANLNNKAKNLRVTNTTASPYPAWNDMTGTWRMIGPYHAKNTKCSNTAPYMSGGFCDRVYINPYNVNNMFAGQSYGGLWVTKDKGLTWKLTDAEFPNGKDSYANRDIYYGEIEAHKADANLVFAATEAGVLKSTNGGDNWVLVNDLNYTTRPTERAYWLATSNHDTNMLLASYGRKIYRSTNGGSTWTMVFDNSAVNFNLSRGQHSTNGISQRWYNICGLAFNPEHNNIAYLAAYNASNQVCVYKSVDYGQTWALMINTNNTNWLKMQITPAAPNRIYFFELFNDLSTVPTQNTILKYDTTGVLVQGLKYPQINHLLDDAVVSETDSTVMYIGGYASGEVHKSTNGGVSFSTNNAGYTSCPNYVHPDVRAFSAVGNNVLVATDGGVYLSEDAMTTVKTAGKWISAADLWGFSSAFKNDIIAVGCDHGPTKIRLFDGDSGWQELGGGDAGDVSVNPVDPRWIYANDGYNKFRSFHNYTTVSGRQSVVAANYKYLAFHPNVFTKAYPANGAVLMLSTDNMATSTNLYTFSASITKVKVALKNPNIIFVLVNKISVYKSTDGGTTFNVITPNTTVTGGKTNISDIDINADGTMVWLSYGNVQTTCKAVKSTDGGATWVNYSTGLPSPTASNITFQRGTNGGVYLSTDGGGIWYRDNSMGSWLLLGNGLPTLSFVNSMFLVPNKNAFRMGTSRGVFEHDLAFTSTAEAQIAADKNQTTTCRKDTVFFRDYSAYTGNTNIQFQWTFEGGNPASSTAENPKVIYSATGTYDVSLTVTDASGNVSTQTLTDFITVTDGYCDPDTLRGKSIKITAQSNYISSETALPNTNTYTMMAWVKIDRSAPNDAVGILSLKSATGNIHLNTRGWTGDSAQVGYHHPNGQWWYNSGLYLKPNVWTHLALVVEPTKISIVKDGMRASHTGRTVVATTFSDFVIGSMIDATWYRNFIGEMDEVAVYKRALTDNEIRNMMHLTKNNPHFPTQTDPDLIAYYQFNESVLSIYDRIGNKDGVFNGSSITRVESSAPISGGVSETMASMTSAGNKTFANVGLTLKLPASGVYPSGAVTAYRLDEKPYLPPTDTTLNKYWIVRNWGTGKTFAALDSLVFAGISLNTSDVNNPANYRFHARPQNSHIANWFVSDVKAMDVDSLNQQKVWFPGNSVTTFGQFVLSRRANPCPCCIAAPVLRFSGAAKQKIQVSQTIDASGANAVQTNQKLDLSAGNTIILNPNFEVKAGAKFKAEIKGCEN